MPILTPRAFLKTESLRVVVLALCVGATLSVNAAESRSKLTREYDLKAVFLFNFAQFVDWPAEAFADETTPFVIGVLGDDPFGKSLEEIVANETVRNHKIVVRRYHDVRDITTCHILFISPSESSRLDRIFDHLKGKSILSVGEADAFTAHGGMVRFVIVENKLRLKIDLEAAKAVGLTISSKLLRQAEIVGPNEGK